MILKLMFFKKNKMSILYYDQKATNCAEEKQKKCQQCGRQLNINNFYYRDKMHVSCLACAEKCNKNSNKCKCGTRATFGFKNDLKASCCSKCKSILMVSLNKFKKCECGKRASFGFKEDNKKIACNDCKTPLMIRIKEGYICKCGKKAFFGFIGEKPKSCSSCMEIGMVSFSKKCSCGKKQPSFGFLSDGKKIACRDCKTEAMVMLRKTCECGKVAHFGLVGNKPTHCYICKSDQMTNISTISRKCKCGVIASFGYPNDRKPTFCLSCKKHDMIDIYSKHCGCGKQASFGFKEDNKQICCSSCRTDDMICLKKILRCKCGKAPSFGFPGDAKPSCCRDCKTELMLNIKNYTRCKCGKIAYFGFKEDSKPSCCFSCRLDNMCNIVSRLCDFSECKMHATYGIPLSFPSRCRNHRLTNMISNPRAKCLKHKCNNNAIYGLLKPIHCSLHKNSNDLDLTERKCVKCGKIDVVNEQGVCINFCLLSTTEYELYQKRKKTKEIRIVNLLTEKFGKPTYQDQIIMSENKHNSKYRPDVVYEFKDYVIIIEVDERQHNGASYNCTDENLGQRDRMLDIYFSFPNKKVFFIRYNPDSYKVKDKVQKIAQTKREELLVKWLELLFSYDSTKFPKLGVLYLYYDEFDSTSRKYFEIIVNNKGVIHHTF